MSKTATTSESALSQQLTQYASNLMEGERIRVRPAQEGDYGILAEWWNEPEALIFLSPQMVVAGAQSVEEQFRGWSKNDTPSSLGYCIEDTTTSSLVGHVTLWGIHPVIRSATLGILLGPNDVEKGMGTEAVALMLRIAFMELGLNKVELNVWEYNERAIHVYQKLGFILEGTQRAACFHAGRYWANHSMGMLRDEYLTMHSDDVRIARL